MRELTKTSAERLICTCRMPYANDGAGSSEQARIGHHPSLDLVMRPSIENVFLIILLAAALILMRSIWVADAVVYCDEGTHDDLPVTMHNSIGIAWGSLWLRTTYMRETDEDSIMDTRGWAHVRLPERSWLRTDAGVLERIGVVYRSDNAAEYFPPNEEDMCWAIGERRTAVPLYAVVLVLLSALVVRRAIRSSRTRRGRGFDVRLTKVPQLWRGKSFLEPPKQGDAMTVSGVLRIVALAGAIVLTVASGVAAVTSFPIIVIADSDLGSSAAYGSAQLGVMAAFAAVATVIASRLIPRPRLRIALAAGLLCIVGPCSFDSSDTPTGCVSHSWRSLD